MSITVLEPGPLTTVQDAGRIGYAAQGYRSCGAADSYAYRLGNALVGNPAGAAVLECTLRGVTLRFETDTVFALTGAEGPAVLDDAPVAYYAPLLARGGSVLRMGTAASGLRSYLAVGGGIVTDGKIYTGFNGLAAELGHFVIQKDGVPCGCGRRGCFEAYASATALIRMTKEELDRCFVSGEGTLMAESRKLNARVAFDAYRAGDAAAKRVIETYIGYLASGIASLINIFQPEVFIIGGGVSNEKQFLLDLLLPRIDAEDFAKNAKKRTRVVIATCGNDAGIIGAAMNE